MVRASACAADGCSADHALHQADAQRLRGRDAHAGEDHLERLAASHEPRQPLRAAAARDDGQVDLGEPELRVFGGDADVAGQGQLEAAAEGVAADRRDDRLGAPIHLAAEVHAPPRLAELGGHRRLQELPDVGARREGLVAAARDHHRAHGVVGAQSREDLEQLAAHGLVHGVVHVGAVQGDGGHPVGLLVADGLVVRRRRVGHEGMSLPATTPRRRSSAISESA
jgi:hypothetical protein